MQLLEDLLSVEEITSIDRVLASISLRFDLLVEISGLDPKNDFTHSDLRGLNLAGADLRGFNFSGSDLRNCVINHETIIDSTTILTETKVEWVQLDALPIVEKMRLVELASNSVDRLKLLSELTAEFGKTTHVVTYLMSAASKTNSLDDFLDFASYLPPELTIDQATKLRSTGQKLLEKKFGQSRSRTRRKATMNFAAENIIERLQREPESLANFIYGQLAEIVNSKSQTRALNNMATVEPDDLKEAFSRIGRSSLR